MIHSGNKTQKTIICEELFIAVMKMLGLNVFYEHSFLNTITGHRKIDFVVGEPYTGDGICYNGMVGVELKTSAADLLGHETGKSFNSFPFNYLLVTDDIMDAAIKFVGHSSKNSHIGIIVIREDCSVLVRKPAGYCDINPNYYKDLKTDIESHLYEKYLDSLACAFAKAKKLGFGTAHDFKSNRTMKIKYDTYERETIIAGSDTCITGTIVKKPPVYKNAHTK